jgi:hypothetical protein
MSQFYDPRIATDYPAYFCRGVQQAANLLYRLSSEDCNDALTKDEYNLKTSDYLIQGSPTKVSQQLDNDYDFNAHTVNEMFEFLCVLSRMELVKWFGEDEIELDRFQIDRLENAGEGSYDEEIHKWIQHFGFTSHSKTNGFRVRKFPKIDGAN